MIMTLTIDDENDGSLNIFKSFCGFKKKISSQKQQIHFIFFFFFATNKGKKPKQLNIFERRNVEKLEKTHSSSI